MDAVSPPVERGGQLFYTRRDKALEKPRLMVRPKASHGPSSGAAASGAAASGAAASAAEHASTADRAGERVLIDANTLSPDGSVSLGSWFPSWDGKQVVYALHENNADEATLHLRDVATGKDSPIDVISGAKYAHPKWTPDNKGFYYEWLPTDPSIPVAERPGRTELRFHRLGTDPKTDPTVFPATLDPKTFLAGQLSHDGRWLIVNVQRGWQRTTIFVRDLQKNPQLTPVHGSVAAARSGGGGGAATLLSGKEALRRNEGLPQTPDKASSQTGEARAAAAARELGFTPFVTDQDAIFNVEWWNGSFYVHTNYDAPNYRVLEVKPGSFDIDDWREIVPETAAKLDQAQVLGNRLVLSYLENATSRVEITDLKGKRLRGVDLPGIGSVSALTGEPDRDEAYYSYSSFTVPNQVYETHVSHGGSEIWSKIDLPLDTSKMQVEQTWYASKDGTRISMFVVHEAGIALDGSHPTLLYGYGGFSVDMTPAFSALIAVWLEHGGVYAMPNLRGGGEYGEAWHRAGMLANKQNTFDDFTAAAEHLITLGY
ncbi:MAG TPA: prolyl oligopeptidase family serine peptidase, partial [Polyangiaceae bacterium]|nr:prolyl oligopeptidase family serine peptidase [Polyangiaceae bacterium]